MTTPPTTRRAARIQAIIDGALVRQHLGQAAIHRRLVDGRHQIVVRGMVFVGSNLDEAIDAARQGGPRR